MNDQIVYLGSDMDGHDIKHLFLEFLKEKGVKAVDLGMFANDKTEFAVIKRELGEKISIEENPLGVLIFGKKNNV